MLRFTSIIFFKKIIKSFNKNADNIKRAYYNIIDKNFIKYSFIDDVKLIIECIGD